MFDADPVSAYYAAQQQQQLDPQGWFGNLLGQVGRPLGQAVGGAFGHGGLGGTIGGIAGNLGRMLPFDVDPVTAAYAAQQQQQQQLDPQGWFGNLLGQVGKPLGQAIGGIAGNRGLGGTIGGIAGNLGRMLPFDADPVTAYYAAQQQQQLDPQGWFGNLLGQVGKPLGQAIGGIAGNRGLGGTIGGIAGNLGRMLPFDVDPVTAAYAQQQQQLDPQSFFSNLPGYKPPMWNTREWLPRQPFTLFNADPAAAYYATAQQQQQLDPQGWFGNLLGTVGKPLGQAIGGLAGNRGLGGTIGGIAGNLGRMLPFEADPMAAYYAAAQQQQQLDPQSLFSNLPGYKPPLSSYLSDRVPRLPFTLFETDPMAAYYAAAQQQQQLDPQGWFGNLLGTVGKPLGQAIGGLAGNRGLGGTIGGIAGNLGRMLPFEADPMAAYYAAAQQQQQLDPQGWFGNLLGTVGKPLGQAIGGLAGNRGLGGTIGGIAGNLGRMLPFEADPMAAYYAAAQQQQQLDPQGWFGNLLGTVGKPLGQAIGGLAGNHGLGGTIGGIAGNLGRMLPFEADPMAAYYAAAQQQQQLDPQGWFGNLLGTVGKPLGQAIGGLAGNRGLGGTIGGIAGNLGRMLPFEADPTAAYYAAAQQQLDPQSFAAFAQRNPQMTSYLGNDALRGRSPYAYSNDWAAQRPILPFEVDPVTAAYAAQQQQLNPQGFFGGLLGGIAGGLGGGAIGGLFGNRGRSIGKNVGNIVGGIAGGILPFQVDPMAQAYGMYQ